MPKDSRLNLSEGFKEEDLVVVDCEKISNAKSFRSGGKSLPSTKENIRRRKYSCFSKVCGKCKNCL